jgi:hypothetical protein
VLLFLDLGVVVLVEERRRLRGGLAHFCFGLELLLNYLLGFSLI